MAREANNGSEPMVGSVDLAFSAKWESGDKSSFLTCHLAKVESS